MLDVVGDHRIRTQVQVLGQQFVDPAVGLVWDEDVDIFRAHLGCFQGALAHLAHFECGPTEY